jgi:hypothetical protein
MVLLLTVCTTRQEWTFHSIFGDVCNTLRVLTLRSFCQTARKSTRQILRLLLRSALISISLIGTFNPPTSSSLRLSQSL